MKWVMNEKLWLDILFWVRLLRIRMNCTRCPHVLVLVASSSMIFFQHHLVFMQMGKSWMHELWSLKQLHGTQHYIFKFQSKRGDFEITINCLIYNNQVNINTFCCFPSRSHREGRVGPLHRVQHVAMPCFYISKLYDLSFLGIHDRTNQVDVADTAVLWCSAAFQPHRGAQRPADTRESSHTVRQEELQHLAAVKSTRAEDFLVTPAA